MSVGTVASQNFAGADVTWAGRMLVGRAAAKAHALRQSHPDMLPIWVPLSSRVQFAMGATWAPARIQRSRLLHDGVSFMNLSDVQDIRPRLWSSAMAQEVGFPLNIYGLPLEWVSFDLRRKLCKDHGIRSVYWAHDADIAAFHLGTHAEAAVLRLPIEASAGGATGSFVSFDQVHHGHLLLDASAAIAPPQILMSDGSMLHVQAVPLQLAIHLHGLAPTNNLWFELPQSVAEGDVESFPFSLTSDDVTAVDVSAFQLQPNYAGAPQIRFVIPLSSIVAEDQPRATFFHEYTPMTLRGGTIDKSFPMKELAWEQQYESPVWVSSRMIERYGLQPRCEEVVGVLMPVNGEEHPFVNLDALEPLSDDAVNELLLRPGHQIYHKK